MPYKAEHASRGDPCDCGFAAKLHRPSRHRPGRYVPVVNRVIGIDGEGVGREPHKYVYLCAGDIDGKVWEIRNDAGIPSRHCLEFILNLPSDALLFGFAIQYDIAKWLQDLPDRDLWFLVHEEKRAFLRQGRIHYEPRRWGSYTIDYMNRRFSVKRGERMRVVWDVFAFYQSKFTKALEDWKILSKEDIERMEAMKGQRGQFTLEQRKEIEAYAQTEVISLAKLGSALIKAHDDAGLKLKSYFGAGSTASALLTKISAKKFRGETRHQPDDLRDAVSRSFFGGRFENRVIGRIKRRIFARDIYSAYPYACARLPCLLCGHWRNVAGSREADLYVSQLHDAEISRRTASGNDRHGRSRIAKRHLALVNWTSNRYGQPHWGALPIRQDDGTIVFPLTAADGWTWDEEFIAAQEVNPYVEAKQAWIYETDCDHEPFRDLPWYYRERCRIGKDGPGIVFKLGPNSVYGKLAQSRGLNPPYQDWVWASNITSMTRAMLLRAIAAATDPRHVLMVATDGIWMTEDVPMPEPMDTGTSDVRDQDGELKPLGGWERKVIDDGAFFARPGIYFPLGDKVKMKTVRGRGIGRKSLFEQRHKIVEAFDNGAEKVTLESGQRFIGIKTGIRHAKGEFIRHPHFGDWIDHSISLTFKATPKRERILEDGSLTCFERIDEPSVPYSPATLTAETKLMLLQLMIQEEQPDLFDEVF